MIGYQCPSCESIWHILKVNPIDESGGPDPGYWCPECGESGVRPSCCERVEFTTSMPAALIPVVKSSAEWVAEVVWEHPGFRIEDPDGWDRRPGKFEASWLEKITREEFWRRVHLSTCCFPAAMLRDQSTQAVSARRAEAPGSPADPCRPDGKGIDRPSP